MMEKTKEYRKELAELFIHVLEEKNLDWKKEWSGNTLAPMNAKRGASYKGINRFRLMLTAMQRGYEDNRWATFHQIQDMGYKLNNAKGQGVKVEYWFPYDRKERHVISWEDFSRLTDGVPTERYILRASYSTVFNGKLIEGLPALPASANQGVAMDGLVDTISRNMGVEIVNDGGDRAFYRPSEDRIHLPKPESFYTDYAYNSTALHELAHATGSPNRLNRNQEGSFGSPEYAYEELIAEISSCFMSGNLQMEQDDRHIENHKAYVQSWIKAIREKPETLARAVAEAEKAAAYMECRAELTAQEEFAHIESSSLEIKPSIRPIKRKMPETKCPRL